MLYELYIGESLKSRVDFKSTFHNITCVNFIECFNIKINIIYLKILIHLILTS